MVENKSNKIKLLPHRVIKGKNGYAIFSREKGSWIHVNSSLYKTIINKKWDPKLISKLYSRGLVKIDEKSIPINIDGLYKFFPCLVEIEFTRMCNLRCKYCYASAGEKNKKMSKKTVKCIAESIINAPIKRIGIQPSGGEPLLEWKNIKKLLEIIRKQRDDLEVKTVIETNGTMITRKIAKELHDYDVKVGVSIDGRSQEHDIARVFPNGKGSYDLVVRGVKCLQDAGYERISSITTFNKSNIKEPEKILRHICIDLGITSSRFNAAIFMGRAKNFSELVITPKELLEAKKRIFIEMYKLKKEGHPFRILDEFFDNLTRMHDINICLSRGCRGGARMFFIDVDGKVFPCTRLNVPKYCIGNVEMRNLKLFYERFIETFPLRNANSFSSCNKCAWKVFCNGGCPGESLHKYGTIFHPSPFCEFIKGYYEFLMDFILEHGTEPELADMTMSV